MGILKALGKSRAALLGTSLALATMAAGVVMFVQPNISRTDAASCDKVNIVYCGFSGSDAAGMIKSWKHYYDTGTDGRYNDLKAVYRWSGATDAAMNNMSTANTKLGTMYRNGDIKINGKVVGHDAWVSARFGAGQAGFVHVEGNVWARKTTTSLAEASTPVLVHFNGNGVADFAVMVNCGNSVRFTPVQPPKPPKPPQAKLTCDSLTATASQSDNHTFDFVAKATATNTSITSYVFNFGDGKSQTVTTGAGTANASHAYQGDGKSFTAMVSVNSKDLKNVTSAACQVTVKTPTPPPTQPVLTCDSLQATPSQSDASTFNFVAKATAKNTTITSYVFDFGDGSAQHTVTTGATTANASHTYQGAGKSFTAMVSVNGKDQQNVTSQQCQVTVKTPTPPAAPTLTCDSLVASIVPDMDNTYNFVAKATPTNTTITSYVFDFGDGSAQQTVTTGETSANAQHTYNTTGQDFTATVTVNSKDLQNVTSDKCKATIKATTGPQLICQELTFDAVAGQANTYTFTATADASNTTITSYVFDFGDGSAQQTVTTDQASAQANHTYANADQDFTASVVVNSKDLQNVTSSTCQVTVPKAQQQECKPGVPMGSSECQPQVLGTSTSSTPPPATTTLPNTGAGAVIGLFGATTVAGALFHRMFFRRKYMS